MSRITSGDSCSARAGARSGATDLHGVRAAAPVRAAGDSRALVGRVVLGPARRPRPRSPVRGRHSYPAPASCCGIRAASRRRSSAPVRQLCFGRRPPAGRQPLPDDHRGGAIVCGSSAKRRSGRAHNRSGSQGVRLERIASTSSAPRHAGPYDQGGGCWPTRSASWRRRDRAGVAFLSGELRQRQIGAGWASLRSCRRRRPRRR